MYATLPPMRLLGGAALCGWPWPAVAVTAAPALPPLRTRSRWT